MSRPAQPYRSVLAPVGPLKLFGDKPELLQRAWKRYAQDPEPAYTHDFHAYPGRMAPSVVRSLLEAWQGRGRRVMDPFCGGGTVAVEGVALGYDLRVSDLNPLAVRLARLRATPLTAAQAQALQQQAQAVVAECLERVAERRRARAHLSVENCKRYAPHTLNELATLWGLISEVDDAQLRECLALAFSAIVVKCAQQRSDTDTRHQAVRLGPGQPTHFFEGKVRLLLAGLKALGRSRAASQARLQVREADALAALGQLREPVDLILSSPPYAGYFDYVDHHALRASWLGLQTDAFARGERFSRRARLPHAAWKHAQLQLLQALRGALAEEGRLILWLGDPLIDRSVQPLLPLLKPLCQQAGLRLRGGVSQRMARAAKDPRFEHLLLFAPA